MPRGDVENKRCRFQGFPFDKMVSPLPTHRSQEIRDFKTASVPKMESHTHRIRQRENSGLNVEKGENDDVECYRAGWGESEG